MSLTASASSENPFPGVPFEGEVPGYTVEVPCQPDGDCGINIVPVINCPQYSAADGRNGYANDGPPGDPHKKVGFAKRFCRNSWLPPTTQADDEDFRNRQQLAIARATEESQAWNAANPGRQKCVQWGPIVHANGVSTASGGVCANPVEAGANTTVPTQEAASVTAPSGSSSSAQTSPVTSTPTPTSNSAQFVEDTSFRGSGHPFTRIFRGQLSTSDCPVGYQGANGLIAAIGMGTFTECWPDNAWQANRLGGEVWEQFKSSNGTYDVMAEVRRRENVQALKAEAKRVAQAAADLTPGIQRCSRWTGYGESGAECAYTFIAPQSGTSPSVGSVIDSAAVTSAGPSNSSASTGTPSAPSAVSTVDYSQYGIGKPFTRIVEGSISTSRCPSGYQAASNYFEWLKATECWPEDAWLAYSRGGSVWSSFKASLGGQSLQAQIEREMRTNAVRALALQQAQELSWRTPGLRRCVSWNVFDQSGAECAFVPTQSTNTLLSRNPVAETSAVVAPDSATIVTSGRGLSRAEWTSSSSYAQLDCPMGFAKETSLNLNGTADPSDDVWITRCVESTLLRPVDSLSATTPQVVVAGSGVGSDTTTVTRGDSTVVVSAVVDTSITVTANAEIASQKVDVAGTLDEVLSYSEAIETDEIARDIAEVMVRFRQMRGVSKSLHRVIATDELQVTYSSRNPRRCLIRSNGEDFTTITFTSSERLQLRGLRTGSCEISVTIETSGGNTYSTQRTFNITSGRS